VLAVEEAEDAEMATIDDRADATNFFEVVPREIIVNIVSFMGNAREEKDELKRFEIHQTQRRFWKALISSSNFRNFSITNEGKAMAEKLFLETIKVPQRLFENLTDTIDDHANTCGGCKEGVWHALNMHYHSYSKDTFKFNMTTMAGNPWSKPVRVYNDKKLGDKKRTYRTVYQPSMVYESDVDVIRIWHSNTRDCNIGHPLGCKYPGATIEINSGFKHYDVTFYLDENGEIHRENGKPAVTFAHTGCKIYCNHGLKSRSGKPAVIYGNGGYEYYKNGVLHSDEASSAKQPTVWRAIGKTVVPFSSDNKNGLAEYWTNGARDGGKTDRPAVKYYGGRQGLSEAYYRDGLYDRDEELGAAVVLRNGGQTYYSKGQIHRLKGPAVVHPNGDEEYYIKGSRMTKTQHARIVKSMTQG
jgi:hypothetical protein